MASTLPVWLMILLSGLMVLALIGYINIYVPKSQKQKAKCISLEELDAPDAQIIYYDVRIHTTWYLILSTIISVLSVVYFIIEDYMKVVNSFRVGIFGHLIGVFLVLILFFVSDLTLLIVPWMTGEYAIRETEKYYSYHYGVSLMGKEELEEYLKECLKDEAAQKEASKAQQNSAASTNPE